MEENNEWFLEASPDTTKIYFSGIGNAAGAVFLKSVAFFLMAFPLMNSRGVGRRARKRGEGGGNRIRNGAAKRGEEVTVGSGKGGKRREREMGPNGGTTGAKPTELNEEKERMLSLAGGIMSGVCCLCMSTRLQRKTRKEGRKEGEKTLPP